jgi:hypothetical protein
VTISSYLEATIAKAELTVAVITFKGIASDSTIAAITTTEVGMAAKGAKTSNYSRNS